MGDTSTHLPLDIRLGAVLPRDAFQELDWIEKGYELGIDLANALNDGRGVKITGAEGVEHFLTFTLQLDRGPPAPNPDGLYSAHTARMLALTGSDGSGAQVLLGSHPEYALSESLASLQEQRLLFHCCVGPDSVYENAANKYMYGVQVSNLEYPYAFVRTVSLLEGQERTFSVVAVQSNVFTSTTCDAALRAIAECEGCRVVHQARYDLAPPFLLYPPPAIEPFTRVAQAISASGAKYVIACGFIPEGSHLLAALSRAHVLPSLSALFMTVAPSDESWFGLVGSDAYWTLSPGQWHYTVRPTVSVLTGPDVSYVDHYTTAYGGPPHYTAAGASGVVELLVLAFTEALESCDLTGLTSDQMLFQPLTCGSTLIGQQMPVLVNATGMERVQRALAMAGSDPKLFPPFETLFGQIKFNEFQRNIAKEPVTTQILKDESGWMIKAVLPLQEAQAQAVIPVGVDSSGTSHRTIAAVAACSAVLLFLLCLFSVWLARRLVRLKNANQELESKNEAMGQLETTRQQALQNWASQLIGDVELGRLIGKGSFGRVYEAKWAHSTLVAVKVMLHPVDRESTIRELAIAQRLRHPNVVAMFHSATRDVDPNDLQAADDLNTDAMQETWMVMELCDLDTLLSSLPGSTLLGPDPFGTFASRKVPIMLAARDIAAGCLYLHDNDVVHGDLKASNILMMTSAAESEPRGYVLKVSDFGLSQQFSTDQTHQTSDYYGTVTHAAPEYMITGKLSKAADVYAFGIVLWEICAGKRPWGGFTHGDIIHRVVVRSETPAWPSWAPPEIASLGIRCLARDPALRPTFRCILREVALSLINMQHEYDAQGEPLVTEEELYRIGVLPINEEFLRRDTSSTSWHNQGSSVAAEMLAEARSSLAIASTTAGDSSLSDSVHLSALSLGTYGTYTTHSGAGGLAHPTHSYLAATLPLGHGTFDAPANGHANGNAADGSAANGNGAHGNALDGYAATGNSAGNASGHAGAALSASSAASPFSLQAAARVQHSGAADREGRHLHDPSAAKGNIAPPVNAQPAQHSVAADRKGRPSHDLGVTQISRAHSHHGHGSVRALSVHPPLREEGSGEGETGSASESGSPHGTPQPPDTLSQAQDSDLLVMPGGRYRRA